MTVSTGVRFCTLPDADEARPVQPPTIITANFNPIMGHLSAAYAVKVGRDLAVGTRCARSHIALLALSSSHHRNRFGFNLFSYDSEVTLGAEWCVCLRSSERRAAPHQSQRWQRSVQRSRSDSSPSSPLLASPDGINYAPEQSDSDIVGVVKVRASTLTVPFAPSHFFISLDAYAQDVRFMWQRKLRNCVVGFGLATDWSGRSPLRAVGVQLQYWS